MIEREIKERKNQEKVNKFSPVELGTTERLKKNIVDVRQKYLAALSEVRQLLSMWFVQLLNLVMSLWRYQWGLFFIEISQLSFKISVHFETKSTHNSLYLSYIWLDINSRTVSIASSGGKYFMTFPYELTKNFAKFQGTTLAVFV